MRTSSNSARSTQGCLAAGSISPGLGELTSTGQPSGGTIRTTQERLRLRARWIRGIARATGGRARPSGRPIR